MSDLIKRQDAIKAFVEETNGVNVEKAIKVVDAYLQIRECDEVWDSIRAIRDCLERAKDEITEYIPSADRPQEWIPCSERLPSNDDWVIVSVLDEVGDTPYRYSDFGWYFERAKCWIIDSEQRTDVVAWMPLPEPWKGADDE